jgi:hypothetical protein
MIIGSCLCGGVRFAVEELVGPFELCHCRRCRKASGSAFKARVGVRRRGFRFLQGEDLVRTFEARVIESPPAYASAWCALCGSPAPSAPRGGDWFEIDAGLFDDDLSLAPDKHIYVECAANWDQIADDLPKYDKPTLLALRRGNTNRRSD